VAACELSVVVMGPPYPQPPADRPGVSPVCPGPAGTVAPSLTAMGAGLQVATEAVTGHGDVRTAALAVAVPVAGYLLGIALVMVVTETPPTDERVYPKLGGAAAVLVIGALAPVASAVAGTAAVMVVLTAWMVLTGGGHRPGADVAVMSGGNLPGSSREQDGRVSYGGGP
jgi:hypothetical protein